jgi:UDP-N-acetylglucosamine acyltransferase
MSEFIDAVQNREQDFPREELDQGVHPKAYVHPDAEIGEEVTVGPFCYVEENVRIGDRCILKNNVNISEHTTIGEGNVFYPHTSIGSIPQDQSYRGEEGTLTIGDENIFRESVTVNVGTRKDIGETRIGSRNMFMAYCHVAHDCIIHDDIVMANGVQLGGHITIHSGVVFGGLAAVHHFVTIGRHAFVGGMSRLMKDVPPFMTVAGDPATIRSLNSEGLRRNGFDKSAIKQLKEAHRKIFRSEGPRIEELDKLKNNDENSPEVEELITFLEEMRESSQGRAREVDRDF